MVTDHMIRLEFSPAELARLQEIAEALGHDSVEEYLATVVRALATEKKDP